MSCFYNGNFIRKRLGTKIFYDKNGSILCVCKSEDNSVKLGNNIKSSVFCNSKINKNKSDFQSIFCYTKSYGDLNKLVVNDSFDKVSKESFNFNNDDSDIFIDLGEDYSLSFE